MDSGKNRPGFPRHMLVVFALLAAGIVAVGYFHCRSYERHHRTEVERQLLAIAKLKTGGLADWRRERLEDAASLFKNASFSSLVRRAIETPHDADAQIQLRAWLGEYQTDYQYDRALLLDNRGVTRLEVPDTREPLAAHVPQDAAETLRSGKITFVDFRRDVPDGPVHLLILVPILDKQDGNRPLGAVALRLNPETYLYPFLSRWPTPSPTAETLLVRRDGDDVLFLNELRFQKNTALVMRAPLTRKGQPAVMAALGQEGIVEGVDYRGVAVIAAVCAVPDSPWLLVARMDTSEVYAPVRERLWIVIALVGILLLGAGAALDVAWRHQAGCFRREKSEVADDLLASKVQYRRLFEAAKDGILILDAQTGKVVDVNPFLVKLLGFSREQFLDKKIWELGFLKEIISSQTKFVELQQKCYVRHEDLSLETADGRRIDAEFASNVYQMNHQTVIQCNIRDITDRKRVEEALRKAHRLLKETQAIANLGGWEYDVATNRVVWTDEVYRIHGVDQDYDPGNVEQDLSFYDPESKPAIERAFRRAVELGEPYDLECRIIRAGGERIWVRTMGTPVVEDGRVVRVVGNFRDITDRKKAEERVAAYQRRLRSLGIKLTMAEEQERRRIAAGLHDNVVQALVLAKMKLGSLATHESARGISLAILEIRGLIDQSVHDTRSLLFDLSPVVLYELGFEPAVKSFLDHMRVAHGLAPIFQTDDLPKPMKNDVRVVLFRAIREVLQNIVKHAHAQRVSVSVRRQGEMILVEVQDDGVGLDIEKVLSICDVDKGFGLFDVRERLDYLGGSLTIRSEPGHGTTVVLGAPLAQEQSLVGR